MAGQNHCFCLFFMLQLDGKRRGKRKMKSKLFYGVSEQSIRERIFEEVNINYDKFARHIVLVPERFTLNAETMLLDALDVDSTFKCEVLSINRLCSTLGAKQDISKQEGVLLVYRLLVENESKLKFFRLNDGRMGFAEEIYETIMQFKSSLVLPNEITTQNGALLKAKLEDIRIIYEAYENYLSVNNLGDGSNKINQLIQIIQRSDFFVDCAVYVVGYDNMTALNLKVLNALIMRGIPIFAGALYNNGGLNEHIYLNDLYLIYENLLSNINYERVFVPSSLDPPFDHLLTNCFAYNPTKLDISNQVRLYKAEDAKAEVGRLVQEIHTLIREGYRYKDINILVSDASIYKDIIKVAFKDIPYYIDTTTPLNNSEIARFILSILEGVNYGFNYDEWFKVVNNYYLGLNKDEKLTINNFLHLYRPNGFKWLEQIDIKEKFQLLLDVVERFKHCEYAQDYIDVISFVLNQFEVERQTLELIKDNEDLLVQKVLKKSFQVIVSMIDTLQKACKGLKVNLNDFIKIFKSGLQEANINLVPLAVDSVFIGDKSSYFLRKDVLFVLGAKYGDLPDQKSDCGILTDTELDNIASRYKIEPKVSELNMRSKLTLLQLISTPKKLIIMYPNVSGDGVNKPSPILDNVASCFTMHGNALAIMDSDVSEVVNDVNELAQGLDDLEGVISYALDDSKDKLNATINAFLVDSGYVNLLDKYVQKVPEKFLKNKAFFVKGYTSISEITEYFLCPYKHFLNRGIRLKKVEPISMRSIDVGNILHRVAELYCKALGTKTKEMILAQVFNEFDAVIKTTNPIIVAGLKKESLRLMGAIENYMASSEYKPSYFEYSFPKTELVLNTKYGDIKVNGKVDRIDVCSDRFLLVDYKTNNMVIESKSLYFGSKLQLPFYSYYYSKKMGKKLAGFAYFPIVDSFETESKVNYRMNGLYVDDKDVIAKLDKKLHFDETGISRFFDIKFTAYKNGNTKLSSNCLNQGTLDSLCEYAYRVCVQAVEEMIEGYIEVSPNIDEHACQFCDYQGICKKELYMRQRESRSVDYKIVENIVRGGSNEI